MEYFKLVLGPECEVTEIAGEILFAVDSAINFLNLPVDYTPSEKFLRGKNLEFVNEAGFYEMIFSSDNKKCLDFRHMVFEEILPEIRRRSEKSLSAKDRILMGIENMRIMMKNFQQKFRSNVL